MMTIFTTLMPKAVSIEPLSGHLAVVRIILTQELSILPIPKAYGVRELIPQIIFSGESRSD